MAVTPGGAWPDDRLLAVLAAAYTEVKRRQRDLRADDRLVDDLDLDSLDAIDMLTILESDLECPLTELVDSGMEDIVTVGDLLERIHELLRQHVG